MMVSRRERKRPTVTESAVSIDRLGSISPTGSVSRPSLGAVDSNTRPLESRSSVPITCSGCGPAYCNAALAGPRPRSLCDRAYTATAGFAASAAICVPSCPTDCTNRSRNCDLTFDSRSPAASNAVARISTYAAVERTTITTSSSAPMIIGNRRSIDSSLVFAGPPTLERPNGRVNRRLPTPPSPQDTVHCPAVPCHGGALVSELASQLQQNQYFVRICRMTLGHAFTPGLGCGSDAPHLPMPSRPRQRARSAYLEVLTCFCANCGTSTRSPKRAA